MKLSKSRISCIYWREYMQFLTNSSFLLGELCVIDYLEGYMFYTDNIFSYFLDIFHISFSLLNLNSKEANERIYWYCVFAQWTCNGCISVRQRNVQNLQRYQWKIIYITIACIWTLTFYTIKCNIPMKSNEIFSKLKKKQQKHTRQSNLQIVIKY